MEAEEDCLVDTNVLLRISHTSDAHHLSVLSTIFELRRSGARLFYSLQSVAELWNVSTRPISRNGLGLSITETNNNVVALEGGMRLLPDNDDVYKIWRRLVVEHRVSGVQVHNARLVALMMAHGVKRLVTLNGSDFTRYSQIEVLDPAVRFRA